MKRLLSALLIALFAVCALTGCGSGKTRPEPEVTAEPTNEPEVTAEPTNKPEVTAEPTESAEKDGALTFGPIEGASSEPAAEGRQLESGETPAENEITIHEFAVDGSYMHSYAFVCGEAGPAQARGNGSGVTASIVDCGTMELMESSPIADAADIAYLSRHIAEAEYRPVTENEEEFAADPHVFITVSVYKADGSGDHFRFTANGYIAHSSKPFAETDDLENAEHISLEPVADAVRLHVAAIAAHNMYAATYDAGDPLRRSWLETEDRSIEFKLETAGGGEVFLADEEAAAFMDLIPEGLYKGILIGAGCDIPGDAVRITAIDKSSYSWEDGKLWTELYLTRDGRLIRILNSYTFRDESTAGGLRVSAGFAVEYDRLFPEAAEYAFGL